MHKMIRCSYCNKTKMEDGYENIDEYGLWFCSNSCDISHKLVKYYH